mgnify:CR=1 FL=1
MLAVVSWVLRRRISHIVIVMALVHLDFVALLRIHHILIVHHSILIYHLMLIHVIDTAIVTFLVVLKKLLQNIGLFPHLARESQVLHLRVPTIAILVESLVVVVDGFLLKDLVDAKLNRSDIVWTYGKFANVGILVQDKFELISNELLDRL